MDSIRNWVENSPYTRALGVQLDAVATSADETTARISLPFREENSNPGQALHGGCAASLAALGGQCVARAAMEDATNYAKQRKTFGKPIGEHQSIQIMLANMATNVQAAHLMVLHAAEKKDRGERADMEAGMAKLFASEMCMQVTIDAMRIHGGYGYTQDLNVERHFRDAPLMMIGEGTNEIQRILIARHLLKDYSTGDFLYESGL